MPEMISMFQVHLYGIVSGRERDHAIILEAADGETAVKDAVRFFRNRQMLDLMIADVSPYWGVLGCVKAYSWAPQIVQPDGNLAIGSLRPKPFFYEWKMDWGYPVLEHEG
jgi:hypothetical protein